MLGDKIKELRTEKEMSQSEFSDAIGISRNYLSEVENNKKIPGKPTIDNIIKSFKLPKRYFDKTSATPEVIHEVKMNEINRIKQKVEGDMKSLNVYKKEFDSMIDVYADLVYHYRRMMIVYEEEGYPVENYAGKKPVLVTQLESLRKDIITYSDRLMLNPKAYQAVSEGKIPPRSKLEEALKNFG
ncbi:helix-turn-helix domain-containing protein [Alkalibacterium gilvum]|uniref:helix-turn-helix domain-containing protein n=1 Tax=Alkalibacterium gilvum TaxID=1130080 RepID=UPI003F925A22